MTVLSSKKILQEKGTTDPDSITSLSLTHKALSDVSCLSEFKNLERLDLGFNNLTSLEGLKSCVNLKWLSVVQNKLQSLKGIEGLDKLTVLNAGKNKLTSIDDVKNVSSLRALILNDNGISSICKLDQMKELNTLVLSRNPISSLGESLAKLKSLTKLSLSNCQLISFDSSLKSCLELKELRLSHNEIMTIPIEFRNLLKLQNLDMGNNLITRWSNVKVLSSLVNLRNLNLQGNPVSEKENLQKRVKKLLPNLHVFNSRPIDKIVGKEVHEKVEDFSVDAGTLDGNDEQVKKPKDKKRKTNHQLVEEKPDVTFDDVIIGKESDKKSRKRKKGDQANIIDSAETPFTDLFANNAPETDKMPDSRYDQDMGANHHGLVTIQTEKKKRNRPIDPASFELLRVNEIGLGGPSTWD